MLNNILPFQQVCDAEFREMFCNHFDTNIFKQITTSLSHEPNINDLIKTNCKYKNIQCYKKCLSNSKKQNDLSIMNFNVRSIVKNKHILEELLHELYNFQDIIAISETRLNNHNINHASLQSYNLVFSNSSTIMMQEE